MNKRLQLETSPYLQQHADNPVDWYPWGDEALQRARDEDKPILLSIGYSACHWCHVMAHESFEDETTAEIMNRLFINIKVDREERPDLDKIYQRAHQLLAQRPGGWPLTVFLMPDDHVPFFAGTYFPKQPRHGLPAFTHLLERIAEFYNSHHDQLQQQNQALMQAMQSLQGSDDGQDGQLSASALDLARRQLEDSMDWQHGGFGRAPKFPHPTNIERLLRHWAGSREDTRALQMACHNLVHMANGGINDQIGGGFCRYSVDDFWMIPHFEKMLYDNGPLLTLYAEAWSATQEPLFLAVTNSTADWVMREMQSPQGGYYSSLDADSEGEEGKFYAWTASEIRDILDADEYRVFARRFAIDQTPNFEGKYYPYVNASWQQLVDENHDEAQLRALVASACNKLFQAREQRIRPGRDEKILCSWNALMIKGMAAAGRHSGRNDLIDSAYAALDFIRENLWRDQRLLATFKDGRAHLNAYLDDYVFLIDAILELLQARWRDGELSFALALADTVLDQFEDKQHGGFFFTSNDHEKLIERPKGYGDEAIPAGNGIAATVLQRLAHITGRLDFSDAAERALQDAWPAIRQIPYAHNSMLVALEEFLNPPQVVVIRGQADTIGQWHQRAASPYAPRRICLAIAADASDLPGLLESRTANEQGVRAYICNGSQCQAPIDAFDVFCEALAETEASATISFDENDT